jgi:hypothetical protein
MPPSAPQMMKMGMTVVYALYYIALEAPPGQRPNYTGACEPVAKSGPDLDTYPRLLSQRLGTRGAECQLLEIPRRCASVEVRHGYCLC